MATRKTASKTPAAKPGRTASKPEGRPAAASAKRSRPASGGAARAAATKPAAALPMAAAEASARTLPVEAPTGEVRYRWIAHAAYLRAEKRGFAPGREVDDWLAAEADFRSAFGGS